MRKMKARKEGVLHPTLPISLSRAKTIRISIRLFIHSSKEKEVSIRLFAYVD